MPRLRTLGAADWGTLVEAGVLLVLAAGAIKLLRFEQVGRLASRDGPRSDPVSRDSHQMVRRIRWATQAVARRLPFRAKCFETGLAAQWMLQRRGYAPTLYFGAKLDRSRDMFAHVWVRLADIDVVGCENAGEFALLACFPGRSSASKSAASAAGNIRSDDRHR